MQTSLNTERMLNAPGNHTNPRHVCQCCPERDGDNRMSRAGSKKYRRSARRRSKALALRIESLAY